MANIISLTGDLGSGKSTVSSILCKTLDYEYIYTGQIQRKIAERYSMTTNELNVYAETHPEIDQEIDDTFRKLGNSQNLVVDSRLAFFFIQSSFKVFLKTNIVVSAQRISGDKDRMNENYSSIQEAALKIVERKKSEVKRYKHYYGVDCLDFTNYDLIIDTTEILPDQVGKIILDEFARYNAEGRAYEQKAFVSPKNLYPTAIDDQGCVVEVVNSNSFDYIITGHSVVREQFDQKIVRVNYRNSSSPIVPNKKVIADWQQSNNFEYLIEP